MSTVDDSWTKSDLLTTVSNGRVDRVLVAGRRATAILDAADLKAVRATVVHALQLGRLTPHPVNAYLLSVAVSIPHS
jgi:uncharacterized protein YifN (PemK superfamily)